MSQTHLHFFDLEIFVTFGQLCFCIFQSIELEQSNACNAHSSEEFIHHLLLCFNIADSERRCTDVGRLAFDGHSLSFVPETNRSMMLRRRQEIDYIFFLLSRAIARAF